MKIFLSKKQEAFTGTRGAAGWFRGSRLLVKQTTRISVEEKQKYRYLIVEGVQSTWI